MKFSPGLVWLILYLKLSVLSEAISDVRISGPSVLENGRQQYVDLICSFQFEPAEYKQLDIKWYFDNEEEPFLQWVPSAGREPQTIGARFRSRVRTEHLLTNTSQGLVTSQVVRIDQPSILTSGTYHCKVATFTTEEISTHSLLIFEPGSGPFLSYSLTTEPESGPVISVSCSVKQVYPEPSLSLSCYSEPRYEDSPALGDTSTTTVRRGMMYDVSVRTTTSSSLSQQTVFSCYMMIPGTQYSLVKKTMYSADNDLARARRVSAAQNLRAGSFLTGVLLLTTSSLSLLI